MKKNALITGGASGIGAAIAANLAEAGYGVIIADLDESRGTKLADELDGLFLKTDLSNTESFGDIVGVITRERGPVDILVNNAGFQHVAPLESFPEDTWRQMLAVMLTAPFLLTKQVWPHMNAKRWGRIVNIASIHGLVASANKAGYVTVKHGLLGLTKTAALEGGPYNITVNALCPAYVRTPLVEDQILDQAAVNDIAPQEVVEQIMLKPAAVKRMIAPREIADLTRYLCSESAACVTGACWTIDCGWTAQ